MHLGFVTIREKINELKKKGLPSNRGDRNRMNRRDEPRRPTGGNSHRHEYGRERDLRGRSHRDKARDAWSEEKSRYEDRSKRK